MSDQQSAAGQAPAAPSTSAQPAAPPAPAAAASAPASNEDPHWLKPRLEQAKASVLRELGVDDVEAAKKALAEAKAKADAEKTAAEKAAEYKTKLDTESAEKARLAATVAEHAARMLMGLTAEQQKAVKDIAGDDAAAQLRAIGALQPTWSAQRATQAAEAAAAAPAAVAPATTSPAPSAPNGAVTSPPDHRAIYVELRRSNPFAAAAYAEQHPEAYAAKG